MSYEDYLRSKLDNYSFNVNENYLKKEETGELPENERITRIKVIGVGGAGCNAINRMIENGITNVEFIAVNTDAQVLRKSLAKKKLQIGARSTKGLGAGAKPEIGEKAAQEDIEEIKSILKDANMVFITAGMGGGTGTGAAPVIAKVAKEMNILTVAIVTIPFDFEGKKRLEIAYQGIKKLKEYVDTILIISNSRIFKVVERKTIVKQAFQKIDEILMQAVQGITNIIDDVGEINVDFADVCTVLSNRGEAIMGVGVASGDNRAAEAARMALENPLIENSSFRNAGAMLVNIVVGPDFGIAEYSEAANVINEYCREDAIKIIGLQTDENLKDKVKIIIVATDFKEDENKDNEIQPQIINDEFLENRKVVNINELRNKRKFRLLSENDNFQNKNFNFNKDDLDAPTYWRVNANNN